MSGAKSPVIGLKASEAKKGRPGARPPIPYVPPTNLIKKQEGEQIKVKMQDGTNVSMATFVSGTNDDYLVHVIVVLRIIKKKGLAKEIKQAWLALPPVRKEMAPYMQAPVDETKEAKKLRLASVEQYKGILKAKRGTAIAVTIQAYEMFRLFVVGDQQTHWDKIVQEMQKCTPRIPGLEWTVSPTREFVSVPGPPSWTASSFTS
jgi:hypothetical protein